MHNRMSEECRSAMEKLIITELEHILGAVATKMFAPRVLHGHMGHWVDI